ncbi:hypothetical protein H0H10_03425, partial [Streptomyces sp. TRM S81-3]
QASGVPGGSPLFTSLFNYRHSHAVPGADGGRLPGVRTLLTRDVSNYPVAVAVDDLGSGFELTVDAVSGVDAEGLCRLLLTCVDGLARALATTPELPLTDVDVVGPDESRRLLAQGRGPSAEEPGALLPELLAERVCVGPDAVAVVAEDGE